VLGRGWLLRAAERWGTAHTPCVRGPSRAGLTALTHRRGWGSAAPVRSKTTAQRLCAVRLRCAGWGRSVAPLECGASPSPSPTRCPSGSSEHTAAGNAPTPGDGVGVRLRAFLRRFTGRATKTAWHLPALLEPLLDADAAGLQAWKRAYSTAVLSFPAAHGLEEGRA